MKRGKTPCEVEQCETCRCLSAAMEGHRHNYFDAREVGVALKQLRGSGPVVAAVTGAAN